MPPTLIKKYGNRRLYDTGDSRYITLDELAIKVRGGTDVRVVDAQTGEDLTQATLTQVILENGNTARLMPAPLLMQLIRLGDDQIAEFFGRYVTSALDLYLQARRGVAAVAQINPLASLPLSATDALARMFMASPFGQVGGFGGFGGGGPSYYPPPASTTSPAAEPPPEYGSPPAAAQQDDVADDRRRDEMLAEMRRELDELKKSGLGKPGAKRKKR